MSIMKIKKNNIIISYLFFLGIGMVLFTFSCKKVDNTPSNASSEGLIKLEGNIKSNLDFYKVTLSWSKAKYSDIESLKYKVLVSTDSTFAPGAVDEFFKV